MAHAERNMHEAERHMERSREHMERVEAYLQRLVERGGAVLVSRPVDMHGCG